jgi:ferredoxin-type protein NapH
MMRAHLINRFLFFILGIILLYAPIALLTRLLVYLTGSPLVSDVHRVCMRMPIQWLAQPWMYGVMIEQPMYLVVVLVLPGVALFFGPLFCGWMCPPGMFTEFLSRLVPDRFKINLAGRVDPAPVRYGVLAGFMLVPFLGGSACCAFCNFMHMQNMVSAAFGDFRGLSHWASFTIVTFVLWFLVLGLFTKGGRGWCNFLCPAGALMGMAHALGARFRFGKAVRINGGQCNDCGDCISACPAWAISQKSETKINTHACNACLDCVHLCPKKSISYKRPAIS